MYDQKELDTIERDRAYHDGFDAAGGTKALCEMKVVKTQYVIHGASIYECNKCFNRITLYGNTRFKYCPNCGAKIEKYVEEK